MLIGKRGGFLQQHADVTCTRSTVQYGRARTDGNMVTRRRKFTILMELARGEKLQHTVCVVLANATNVCAYEAVSGEMFQRVGYLKW